MRKTYSELVTNKYVSRNLEDAKLFEYLDFKDKNLESYYYDELNDTVVNGYPISSDFVDKKGNVYNFLEYEKISEKIKKECRLRYLYLPHFHELYIGTTGSGKTTGCIEPQIRAISSQKNKPNLFITDPKGELYKHHAEHLNEMGYKVYILNFKDVSRSYMWNPLQEIYEAAQEVKKVGKGYKKIEGMPGDDLTLVDPKKKYKGVYYSYNNLAFASVNSLNNYIESELYTKQSNVSSLINGLSRALMPPTNAADPVWNEGARDLLYGIILSLAEESQKPNTELTKEMMTLRTVNDMYALVYGSFADGSSGDKAKAKLNRFTKDKSAEANNKLSTVTKTATSTAKGFLSNFQTNISPWMKGHVFKLTADTNIKLFESDQPFAIFIATRDYDKSDNVVASLFIDWAYRQALNEAERRERKGLPLVDFHFLLDEFGNIPAISDFSNKISTARSRHLWFHLFVQSYDQLEAIYGPTTTGTILDNCNSTIFLGSQSFATKKKFSEECGYKSVESLSSMQRSEGGQALNQLLVVNISDLDKIEPGVMYIKRINTNVIRGGYIRGYQAAAAGYFTNMYSGDPLIEYTPFNNVIPDEDSRVFFPVCPPWYKHKSTVEMVQDSEGLDYDDDDEDYLEDEDSVDDGYDDEEEDSQYDEPFKHSTSVQPQKEKPMWEERMKDILTQRKGKK